MKDFTAWVVVDDSGLQYYSSIEETQGASIELFLKGRDWHTWVTLKDAGYRCVKITCTEAAK